MKKLLLSIAFVLLAGATMAQSTLKFTFDRNNGNPIVTSTLDNAVNEEIQASIAISPNNGYLPIVNRGNETNLSEDVLNSILSINRNTTAATDADPNTYTLTVSNLPANYTFTTVKVTGYAVNSSGQFQGLSTPRSRNFKISYCKNGEMVTTEAALKSICGDDHCLGTPKTHDFAVEGATANNELVIKVQIYTDGGDGCFYGLGAIELALVEDENVETAIENVEVENAEQVIYDLTGRRVEEITEGGIYIVNGNKVLVK